MADEKQDDDDMVVSMFCSRARVDLRFKQSVEIEARRFWRISMVTAANKGEKVHKRCIDLLLLLCVTRTAHTGLPSYVEKANSLPSLQNIHLDYVYFSVVVMH